MTKKDSGKYVMRNEKKNNPKEIGFSQHLMASLANVFQATLMFLQVFKYNCSSCCRKKWRMV